MMIVHGCQILWAILLSVLIAHPATGAPLPDNVRFRHLNQANGLSSSMISSIVQDDLGFVWIGTQDGLNRYDGYQMTIFRNIPDDSNSISHNQITCLLKDISDNIWIGTAEGLNVYDQLSGKFRKYIYRSGEPSSLTSNSIRSLFQDSRKNIWIGTSNGLNRLTPETGEMQRFYHQPDRNNQLSANVIFAVAEDSSGRIWIGTHNGLSIYDPETSGFINILFSGSPKNIITRNAVIKIRAVSDSVMLIGTLDGIRRIKLYPNDGNPTEYTVTDADRLESVQIFDMIYGDSDRLWIGSSRGLICRDLKSEEQRIYGFTEGDPQSLSDNKIYSLMIDYSGLIWAGSAKGVNIYDPSVSMFKQFFDNHLRKDDLNNDMISAIFQDEKGIIWIGTSLGLYSYDPAADKYKFHAGDDKLFKALRISDIKPGEDPFLWLATSNGVYRFNRKDETLKPYRYKTSGFRELKYKIMRKLEPDREGGFWVGSFGGLLTLNPRKGELLPVELNTEDPSRIAANSVTSMLKDRTGRLWIGCEYGLNMLEKPGMEFKHYYHQMNNSQSLGSNHVTDICEDQNGQVWIGTYGGGLNQYRSQTDNFYRLTSRDGLPGNVIKAIQPDEQGNLWVSTGQSICRITPDPDPPEIKIFDRFDGLGNIEFNPAVRYADKLTGKLYFGGNNGMLSFDPGHISFNMVPPKIVFTGLRIFNKPVLTGSSILPEPLCVTDSIVLSYDQNFFSFGFAAVHFGEPAANRYAYRLLGFDQDWIYTDSDQRFCIYSNMPPGDFTLQVTAANEDGFWNRHGISVHLRIVPPFWHTLWFRILFLIFCAFLVILIIQTRTRQIARRNRSLQELNVQLNHEIKERTEAEGTIKNLNRDLEDRVRRRTYQLENTNRELEAFAYSVSHDLRAPLRSIGGFSQILSDEYRDKLDKTGEEYLRRVRNGVRKMSQLIDDLLKLSRISRDELNIQSVNLSAIMHEISEQKQTEEPERTVEIVIQPDINLLCDIRLMRHALENLFDNAWKFTANREKAVIEFGTVVKNGAKWYYIRDNGAGFDMKYINKLFTPFGRLHTSEEFPGTGIGLATVQRIIHRHGGQIRAESSTETGTVFSFSLDYAYREPSNPGIV